ncbi:hypothetical protein NCS52_00492900 [Fusarium sp. LHS14.1]|nr:hypothetical protein NCS52_00492900 [Fusarium sp. LHS14.1]
MSKQDPADQVKFLVSCIGHTSNGRPDFQAVADELSIVSKAAAQKRYERMLKAHGINRPGAIAGDSVPATPTKRKAKGEGAGSAKKKPARGKAKKESDEDEEAEAKPKPKPKRGKQADKVKKEEEESDSGESRGSSLTEPPAASEEGSS